LHVLLPVVAGRSQRTGENVEMPGTNIQDALARQASGGSVRLIEDQFVAKFRRLKSRGGSGVVNVECPPIAEYSGYPGALKWSH
jgi:hypothetical protein